jgi:hypothetical protein
MGSTLVSRRAFCSDRRFVARRHLASHPPLLWTPPGMPPGVDLDPGAELVEKIVISGIYGWRPKRRDADLFAQDYAAVDIRLPVRVGDLGLHSLSPEAIRLLQPLPSETDNQGAKRFGVITDRFQAGHKLKTLAYLANNQIVLSCADISFAFDRLPGSNLFVRRIRHAAVASIPGLRNRFARFIALCAREFAWEGVSRTLLDAVQMLRYRQKAYRP